MANYVDATTQTIWAGLTKSDLVRPDILFTAPDTNTPPDEMITGKPQTLDMLPPVTQPRHKDPNAFLASTLLERRKNRPALVGRISLPNSQYDDEILPSPPPTYALLSPLPAANKLYAGHTPLIPRARSPVQNDEEQAAETEEPPVDEDQEDQSTTPQQDTALTGPLILPTNPVDGADDHIALDALDDELARVAKEQERFSKLKDASEPAEKETVEHGLQLSRKASQDSHAEVVDGVRLKSPPLNFGTPLGQA